MEKEKIEIKLSQQMKRKLEVFAKEFGLSNEESIEFILNHYFLEKSEIIFKAMENN